MRALLLYISAISLVSAVPLASKLNENPDSLDTAVAERSGPLESAILDLLESLRDIMVNGTDTIPPLDPLVLGSIQIDDETLPIEGAFVKIDDLTVRDFSNFRVEHIRVSIASIFPLRQRLEFDFVIPAVNVDTSGYALSMNIFGGSIFGKGDMRLRITNPRVSGNLVFSLRRDNGLFLTIVSTRINLGLDSFEPVITGMFDDEASSDFVSRFLGNLVLELLNTFDEDISNFVSTAVMLIGNAVLEDFDLTGLLPFAAESH